MPEASSADDSLPYAKPEAEAHSSDEDLQPLAPVRVKFGESIGNGLLFLVTVGGSVFALLSVMSSTTAGATRSSKLQWVDRQRQIDEALAEQQQPSAEHER